MHSYLSSRLPEIREACITYRVKQLYVFGSVIDGRFRPGDSDIDMWLELESMTKREEARTLMQVWLTFQRILNCEVDLLLKNDIRGEHFKKYLELYQVKVFDSGEEELYLTRQA